MATAATDARTAMPERRRATITDVAARAGVSKATVSVVLSGKGRVKDATRARVLAAAEELDYRTEAGPAAPHALGRAGGSIAVIVREADNPYFGEVVAGVREAADARGFTVLVASSEGDYEAERRAVRLLH